MSEKYNILTVMQEPEFKKALHDEYLFRLSQLTTPGKVLSYFEDKPDQLYSFMLNFVECILLGSPFFSTLGFTKREAQSVHDKILLPAIGNYLDKKRGIVRSLQFIPNTDKTRSYDTLNQVASGQLSYGPDCNDKIHQA